jgi:hypothetical protein
MHDNFFKDLAIRLTVVVVASVTICVVMDYLDHKDKPKAKNA